MLGYIYVTDDPWFAVSDEEGRAAIAGLPAGRYLVTLWHPGNPQLLPQTAGELQAVSYTHLDVYKRQQHENTGIAELLRDLAQHGIDFKDLQSSQSSLEEIFVGLIKESRT